MPENNSGAKTLLLSIIMSSPGPLVVGLSLISGHSTTQIADFVRRSVELLAIVTSFIVYNATARNDSCDEVRRKNLERISKIFIGSMMCIAGVIMTVLALALNNAEKGNVIPTLVIAALSASANSIFWVKYIRLNHALPNAILAVQSKLYRAKTLVDISVLVALTAVVINPMSAASYWLDAIGSLVVAAYLSWTGAGTVYEEITNP